LEDNDLVTAAVRGDQQAFTHLVERYRRYIYSIAYKILRSEDDALDVTQNVFLRLVERLADYDGRGAFRSWVGVIAAREAVNHCRRPSRREVPTDPETLGESPRLVHPGAGPADARSALEKTQRLRLVDEAIADLSPQQRAIVVLRLKEGMPPREIAQHLGLPPRQVRSQLHRAITRLRENVRSKEQ